MNIKALSLMSVAALLAAGCQTVAGPVDQSQRMLNQMGYNAGSVDGAYGNKTQTALEAFYADNGGSFDGTLDENEVEDLRSAMAARGMDVYSPMTDMEVALSQMSNPRSALLKQMKQGVWPFSPWDAGPGDFDHNVYSHVEYWQRGDMNNDGYDDIVMAPTTRGDNPGFNSGGGVAAIDTCTDWSKDMSNVERCKVPFATPIIAWGGPNGTFVDLDGFAFVSHRKDGDSKGEIRIADFNGDGFKDVWQFSVGRNNYQGEDILWLSDGTGKHWVDSRSRVRGLKPDFTHGGTVGDIDGDGDIDVVASSNKGTGNEGIVCYINDGKANFKRSSCGGRGLPEAANVALADFNGDGSLDAVIGGCLNAGFWCGNEIWLNNGSGKFNEKFADFDDSLRQVDSCIAMAPFVAAADIDSDGDMDVVYSAVYDNYALNQLVVQENLGGGEFKATKFDVTKMEDYGSSIRNSFTLKGCTIYDNNRGGKLAREGHALNQHIRYMHQADIDGDGDLDLWISNHDGSDRIWNDTEWDSNSTKNIKRAMGGWLENTGDVSTMSIRNSKTRWVQFKN